MTEAVSSGTASHAGERLARRNVGLLMAAQSLSGAGPSIIISLGGIVGQMLAPSAMLATVPVSLFNLGVAVGTLPAAWLMRRVGRRAAYMLGALVATASGIIAAGGVAGMLFAVFCIGTFAAGFSGAFVQSYRFAAADAAPPALRANAISRVMIGGLIAGVIGPQLVIWTRDSIPGIPFSGSFLAQSMLALATFVVVSFLRPPPMAIGGAVTADTGRPILTILLTPRFLLAIASGVVSYGLMSFVMTAAPVAMVGCGHTIGEAALGIQWHVLAMFGPSFFTGKLIARFGKERVTAFGLVLIAASAGVALLGLSVANFWIALVLLGVGWNFGFIGATSMVTECHTPAERAKVQGANDFLVFGSVALASFSSGTLLNVAGWSLLNQLVFPAVAIVLVPLLLVIHRKPAAA